MRPYIAIIRDAFHEAFSSRVLWLLLAAITILLAGILPIAIIQQPPTELRMQDVDDGKALAIALTAAADTTDPSPARQIWLQLDEEGQEAAKALAEVAGSDTWEYYRNTGELAQSISDAVDQGGFYDAASWQGVDMSSETEALLAAGVGNLSEYEIKSLNLLLIADAFPDAVSFRRGQESRITFFGSDLGSPLPQSKEELVSFALQGIMGFLIGFLGMFIAILVTSSMIPHTYNEGAIDLLLSKPVNRSFLFLAKFFGACAFVTINIVYLAGGMWLLAGLRFDMWRPSILLSIPVFLFLYIVFYSVSALAGVVWRNAIVAVVVTFLFWFVFLSVGVAKESIEEFVLNDAGINGIVPMGDDALATSQDGGLMRWNAGEWREIMRDETDEYGLNAASFGTPAYDPVGHRILTFQYTTVMDPMSVVRRNPQMREGYALIVAKEEDGWTPQKSATLLERPYSITVDEDGDVIVRCADGLYRLDESDEGPRFTPIALGAPLGRRAVVALDRATGALAVGNQDALAIYDRAADGAYTKAREAKVEGLEAGPAAYGNGYIAHSPGGAGLTIYDHTTLEPVYTIGDVEELDVSMIRAVSGTPQFVVLTQDNRVAMVDAAARTISYPNIPGQGHITAIAPSADAAFWVAGEFRTLARIDLATMDAAEQRVPPMSKVEAFYRYALRPLHTVFPRPGELSELANRLLSQAPEMPALPGQMVEMPDAEPVSARDVWPAVLRNLAFVIVILGLGCVHVTRKDY